MITNKSKNKITKQNVDARFIHLVDVWHEDVGHFLYTDSDEEIFYDGQTWGKYDIDVVRPEVTSTGVSNGSISISSVDQTWIERIRNLNAVPGNERFKARLIGIMEYEEGNETVQECLFDENYMLSDANWDGTTLSWTMIYDDNWAINIPVITCNSLVAYGIA